MFCFLADFKTLKAVIVGKIKGEKIKDDKTMIMEQVIQLVSNLKGDSKLRAELTNTFVQELWETLDHPPLLYVGDKYQYRQADGSNNVGDYLAKNSWEPLLTVAEHHVSQFGSRRHKLCAVRLHQCDSPGRIARSEFDLRLGHEAY